MPPANLPECRGRGRSASGPVGDGSGLWARGGWSPAPPYLVWTLYKVRFRAGVSPGPRALDNFGPAFLDQRFRKLRGLIYAVFRMGRGGGGTPPVYKPYKVPVQQPGVRSRPGRGVVGPSADHLPGPAAGWGSAVVVGQSADHARPGPSGVEIDDGTMVVPRDRVQAPAVVVDQSVHHAGGRVEGTISISS